MPDIAFWILCTLFLCVLYTYWDPYASAKSPTVAPSSTAGPAAKVKQTYDAFLVLDVEATCQRGADFNYPNEIIEFPVCLLRWKDRDGDKASQLQVVDEFRSFVKPSWRPSLTEFCTELTGTSQEQVDSAPEFPAVLRSFRNFLVKHKLIEKNGKQCLRFCWCSDGPFDIRDFVVKQLNVSFLEFVTCLPGLGNIVELSGQISIPDWMSGDVLDVRALVAAHTSGRKPQRGPSPGTGTLNIPAQLMVLGLTPFIGRQHSGIDDGRNLARILAQLAQEGVRLQPNTAINPRRRWFWMGKSGRILEENLPNKGN